MGEWDPNLLPCKAKGRMIRITNQNPIRWLLGLPRTTAIIFLSSSPQQVLICRVVLRSPRDLSKYPTRATDLCETLYLQGQLITLEVESSDHR